MTKERKVRKRGKTRRSRRRGRSGEEVGSRGRRENKQEDRVPGRKGGGGGGGGGRGKEGGRLWLSALEVFNCLHWRPPHQSATPDTHTQAKEWWYRERGVGRKKKTKNLGAFQINSCRRKWFYSEHNKCPCHLETSQIASHRFVAPKKAQNAHGGVYDCRPSLKIQSCLCSAMKNHSALLLFLLQVLACALSAVHPDCRRQCRNTADNHLCSENQHTYSLWNNMAALLEWRFYCKYLTITPFKTHFLCVWEWLIFCTYTVLSAT